MQILKTGPDGRPREVELTPEEVVLKQVHENLLDRGMCQANAILAMTGIDLPGSSDLERTDPHQQVLMGIMTGPFLAYLGGLMTTLRKAPCEIVTSHVVLVHGDPDETIEHIATVCNRPAIAVIDDDDDDVTVCLDHLPAGATVVERLDPEED